MGAEILYTFRGEDYVDSRSAVVATKDYNERILRKILPSDNLIPMLILNFDND